MDTSNDNNISNDISLDSLAEELYNIQSFNKDVILDCLDIDDYDHTQLKAEIDYPKFKEGLPILKISSKGKSQKKKLLFDLARNQILCGKKKKVSFSEIDEIRVGHKTNIFNQYKSKNLKDESTTLSFSILFSGNLRKSMDFICSTLEERRMIVSALYHIVQDSKSVNNEYNFVKREWDAVGKDSIDFPTLKKLLARLNFTTSDAVLHNLMEYTDANSDYHLDFSEFSNLLKLLRSHPELKPVFYKYSGFNSNGEYNTSEFVPIEGMIRFFRDEQNEIWTEQQCRDLIEKYHHEKLGYISFNNFEEYLCGDLNQVNKPIINNVYQDTSRPLSHYFINSSHNTYLSGNQLKGLSTSEMYTTTLRAGCKCVELDVWDGNDGEPIIFHGNTLTSQIKFSHVCETIKARGFETSPFPVILSLEVHCSVPQQIKMAQHMKTIFGEMLPTPLPEGTKELPSLESLKYKIVLKGHVSHAVIPLTNNDEYDGDFDLNDEEEEEEVEVKQPGKLKKPVKVKIAQEMCDIIHLVSHGFKSTSITKEIPAYMIHSLVEEKTKNLAATEPVEMIEASQNHLIRIYPRGTRFNSSNFDPVVGWSIGCQLVALNQQTSSEPMWLNEGLFSDNGACGYVLKPPYLLPGTSQGYNPLEPDRVPGSKYSRLIVQVISARQLPKYTSSTKGEVIDPYVTLSMHGVHFDQKVEKTKTIDNNGFSPYWGEEFEFPLYNSQIALLLIRVDDKDKLGHNRIGHNCIRVENIRNGYRIIRLKNNNNRTIPLASLLCKFTLVQ